MRSIWGGGSEADGGGLPPLALALNTKPPSPCCAADFPHDCVAGEELKNMESKVTSVVQEVIVATTPEVAWFHWTTIDGLQTLFMPAQPPLVGHVEMRPLGPYSLHFSMDAPEDMRGTEGSQILAYDLNRMLSLTWRNPPHVPNLRPFFTHLVITIEALGVNETKVRLVQSGFGDSSDWHAVRTYFEQAWATVLGRLVARY
jgi:uncharacterized protein YndB with AHSA1/START domain